MLSFKRLLYIVLIVAGLGGVIMVFNGIESSLTSTQIQSQSVIKREFLKTVPIDESDKPEVWILGNSKDEPYRDVYRNVRQYFDDIHLTAVEKEYLDVEENERPDLVIFCDPSISCYADPAELEALIAGGGRVILAAGIGESEGDLRLLPTLGIVEKSKGKDYHDLVFEKPMIPVQIEKVYYGGNSASDDITVSDDATVYIREADKEVPVIYTFSSQKGSVCVINGTFLADKCCVGLLAGAICVLVPDFIYPVLGIKTVFLDHFPEVTPEKDELCRHLYGYSMDGFVLDVVWPSFQGISLRTDTPYTAGVLHSSTSGSPGKSDDSLPESVGRFVLQFDGELVDAGTCQEKGDSLFPLVITGDSMEDDNLFTACSELGAYGLVSMEFDLDGLIVGTGNDAVWNFYKKQIGLFESELLGRAPWLDGRTFSQAEDDVNSYQEMNYGWKVSGSQVALECSDALIGQAFFYHTDRQILDAEGLSYQYAGNGYYLLRALKNNGMITLEEE